MHASDELRNDFQNTCYAWLNGLYPVSNRQMMEVANLLWNCTDYLPVDLATELENAYGYSKSTRCENYAQAAQELKVIIEENGRTVSASTPTIPKTPIEEESLVAESGKRRHP